MSIELLKTVLPHLVDPSSGRVKMLVINIGEGDTDEDVQVLRTAGDPPSLLQAMSGVSVLVLAQHEVLYFHFKPHSRETISNAIHGIQIAPRTIILATMGPNEERSTLERRTRSSQFLDLGNVLRHRRGFRDLHAPRCACLVDAHVDVDDVQASLADPGSMRLKRSSNPYASGFVVLVATYRVELINHGVYPRDFVRLVGWNADRRRLAC